MPCKHCGASSAPHDRCHECECARQDYVFLSDQLVSSTTVDDLRYVVEQLLEQLHPGAKL